MNTWLDKQTEKKIESRKHFNNKIPNGTEDNEKKLKKKKREQNQQQ